MSGAITDRPILVVGASGRTGRLLCADLVARGWPVRALVRQIIDLPEAVEQVLGDLREEDVFARVLPGCGSVIYTACGTGGQDRGMPRLIDFDAVAACAAQAARLGLDRVVLLSSAGVTQPEHPHNCTFGSVLKWKFRGEQALRQSGVPYTVVRALGLRDRPTGQQGVRIVQGDRIAFGEDIARGDAARVLGDVLSAQGLGAGLSAAALVGATFEMFNDATLPAGQTISARERLMPDAIGHPHPFISHEVPA